MPKPEIFGSLNPEKIQIEAEVSPLSIRSMNSTISSRKNRQKNVWLQLKVYQTTPILKIQKHI